MKITKNLDKTIKFDMGTNWGNVTLITIFPK